MAKVDRLEEVTLTNQSNHTQALATYSIVTDDSGSRCLQIDTYGSVHRKLKGKKSQSMRFSPSAIAELKQILEEKGL